MSLDPRTKLLLSLFYVILVLAIDQMAWLLATWGGLLLLIFLMRKGRAYLRWLRLLLPMIVFLWAVVWWLVDLPTAMVSVLRLLAIASTFFPFFSTTAPEDLGNSLVQTGVPYTFAFLLSASLQFAPVISRKAKNIAEAQRSRGIPLEPGWRALRYYPALFGPLIIQAFQLGDELAEAMEVRGFGREGRTFWKVYRLRLADWLALMIGLLALIVIKGVI